MEEGYLEGMGFAGECRCGGVRGVLRFLVKQLCFCENYSRVDWFCVTTLL